MHSIRRRLYVGYAALIFLLALTLVSALRATSVVQRHFNAAVQVDSALSGDVGIRLLTIHDQRQALQEYMLLGEADDLSRYHQLGRTLRQAQQKTVADGRMRPTMLPLFAAITHDEQTWTLWADSTATQVSRRGSQRWLRDSMARGEALAERTDARAFPLFDTLARQQRRDLSDGLQAMRIMKILLCIILVAAILIVGGVGWLMIRSITVPISYLARCAEAIGRGNMTAEVAALGASEFQVLARSMDTMRARLLLDSMERERQQQSLAQFAAIVDSTHDAVITMSTDGRITTWNPGAENLYGYTAEEAIGKNLAILEPAGHDGEIGRNLQAACQNNAMTGVERFEGVHATKSGRLVTIAATLSPLRNANEEIVGFTSISRDVTEQKTFEEQLTYQALHDALTGLPNRTLLHDRLGHALTGARRSADTVALLVMDLDRFKEVNDSLGHAAGDELLQEVARRLVAAVRTSDTVARLGGDEFSIILPDSGSQQADRTARRVLQALRLPILVQDQQIYVDASIGIALFPEHGQSAETLLRHADVAMYAAKRTHKGISFYTPEHDLNSPAHLALISRLRDAIEQEKIQLHYQPIVNLDSGRVERLEALARWRPEGEDFIPPSQFIPVAEETGLIEPLTLLVLKQALAQCAAWRRDGLELGVAVNLSVSSMLNASLPDLVASSLRRWGLDGSVLMLEVTETALMTEPEGASAVLHNLHRLGVRIAIDDFGTGYSSLGYLQRLPIDEIKIDRSFIQHMGESERVIVRSVIDLGKNLNLEVTAEGVEDEETWELLRSMECATVQGYFLSRPIPAGEVASWLTLYERRSLQPDRHLTVIHTEHALEPVAGL